MKRFFKRLGLFVFFSAGLTVVSNLIGYAIQIELNHDNPAGIRYAFIGHSHVRTGISDSLASKIVGAETKNLGVGGQGPFWTTQAAEKAAAKGVKNIILNFTNNSLTSEWKTFDRTRGKREYYLKGQLNLEDWHFLFCEDFFFATQLFFRAEIPNNELHGGFIALENSFVPKSVIGEQVVQDHKITTNIEPLAKLAGKFPKTNFFLIRMPMHPDFKRINEVEYLKTVNSINCNNNVYFADFVDFCTEDSLFSDLHHLNVKGANKFTPELVNWISHALQLP